MPAEEVYWIVLADDHALLRQAYRRIIEPFAGLEVVGEASNGCELLLLLQKRTPNLILLDADMPHLQGMQAANQIKKRFPPVKILILSMHKTKEYLYRALAGGADGYVLKEEADTELLQAIQQIRSGGTYISSAVS